MKKQSLIQQLNHIIVQTQLVDSFKSKPKWKEVPLTFQI